MNPLKRIANNYIKWRHSKGYGVHSPFAFHIVENVINPGKYGYYGYSLIDRAVYGTKDYQYDFSRENARFLLRLAVALRVKKLISTFANSGLIIAAAKGAGIDFEKFNPAKISRYERGSLLVLSPSFNDTEGLKEFLSKEIAVYALNPDVKVRDVLENHITRGVVFIDINCILTVPRNEMAYVKYETKLR